ncbi:MAG: bifunctional riboflavin kinase/FAD synthetase [Planctomycetota bacterium]
MTEIVLLSDIAKTKVPAALHGGTLSIGNFDGVHLGHATLLGRTRSMADELGGPAVVCVFDPHPIAILRRDAAPKRLTAIKERARRLDRLGIDFLVVCETSRELLNYSAEAFFQTLVIDNLHCRGMVEGDDFCFGKDRGGDVALLRRVCSKAGIRFEAVSMEVLSGDLISSTRIRERLLAGDVRAAREMMAIPHRVSGVVVHGDARGRTIGFPTANLEQIDVILPAPGVYAALASVDNDKTFHAAVNIGESPTFRSGHDGKVEAHLLNFDGDLYGKTLSVDFVDRVRDIARFESAEALASQLRRDVESAQNVLQNYPPKRDT